MLVSEIYESIQGEGRHAGLPMTFVRFAGCNLDCEYCDSRHAREGGTAMTPDEIIAKCLAATWRRVQLTGGEPMLQDDLPELCRLLIETGFEVVLETNGTLDLSPIPPAVIKVVDIKTPGSGHTGDEYLANIPLLSENDELKFVVTSRDDFDWAGGLVRKLDLPKTCGVLFSAAVPLVAPPDLARWILDTGLDVRFNPQVHRHIWGDDVRGK
ncbi:MAG: radical SAM protein [Deltaproteobacteria bacterium]|nr:radical SAM protein [Deltaproteobacteria bacterium]